MIYDIVRWIESALSMISWQLLVLACIVWCISKYSHRAPASLRYGLWMIVLAKAFIPPFVNLPSEVAVWQNMHTSTVRQEQTSQYPKNSDFLFPHSDKPAVATSPYLHNEGTTSAHPKDMPLPIVIWFIGIVVMGILLVLRNLNQRRMIRSVCAVDEQTNNLLAACSERLGITRLPEIGFSSEISAPMLVGVTHPLILMPRDICQTCGQRELTAMLLHELAHIKRRDMIGVWACHLAQILFFFHPAIWLAGREIERERELACDEMVLSSYAITRKEYAAGYLSAVKLANGLRMKQSALSMAEPFDIEKRRLMGILDNAIPVFSRKWISILLLMSLVGLPSFSGDISRADVRQQLADVLRSGQGITADQAVSLARQFFSDAGWNVQGNIGTPSLDSKSGCWNVYANGLTASVNSQDGSIEQADTHEAVSSTKNDPVLSRAVLMKLAKQYFNATRSTPEDVSISMSGSYNPVDGKILAIPRDVGLLGMWHSNGNFYLVHIDIDPCDGRLLGLRYDSHNYRAGHAVHSSDL